jgi:hypothetical protein
MDNLWSDTYKVKIQIYFKTAFGINQGPTIWYLSFKFADWQVGRQSSAVCMSEAFLNIYCHFLNLVSFIIKFKKILLIPNSNRT